VAMLAAIETVALKTEYDARWSTLT
jgi:hypothetical protein